MGNKKKYIIAAVLFIFLGLTIFSFANPGNNNEELKNNNNNNQQQEENKDPNKQDPDTNNTTNNNGSNNVVRPVVSDDSYEKALAAVQKAEQDLTLLSYEEALNLVADVTGERKVELENRLLEVKNCIDVSLLVKTLNDKVSLAETKENMDSAREYRTLEDIVNKVNNLVNEELKNNLQEQLLTLATLLDDVDNPVVNVEDGAILSTETIINVTDVNEFSIILKKDGELVGTIINNDYSLSEEGIYNLTVIDKAFNITVINFTLDMTAPTVNVAYSEEELTNQDVTVTITSDEEIQAVEGWTLSEDKKVLTQTFTENTNGTVRVKDLVGNYVDTTYEITNIDKVLPEVISITQTYNEAKSRIDVVIKFSEKVLVKDHQGNEIETTEVTKYYYRTKDVSVDFKDLAGNENSYSFTADMTAPTITAEYLTKTVEADKTATFVKPIVTVSDNVSTSENITLVENCNVNMGVAGTYTCSYQAIDEVGNTSTQDISVIVRDTTAPTIELKGTEGRNNNEYRVAQDTKVTLEDVTATAKDNVDNDKILEPVSIRRYYPKETGKASHVYDATNGFDTSSVGYYEIKYEIKDSSGNKSTKTMLLVVNAKQYIVYTFADLKEAINNGGKIVLQNDIVVEEILNIEKGINIDLDMNGKKLTLLSSNVDPMINMKTGSSLVIRGNGVIDLEDNYFASFIVPRGDLTIYNGTFTRNSGGTNYGSFFVGISGGRGKLVIYDGYFDSGYYKEGDWFNNSRNNLNLSWGQNVKVYGGTFVGQNPAWGDEGMAKTNPDANTNYCQGTFFEGQNWQDTSIPSTYQVIEGTTKKGIPTYTVRYSKN